MKYLLLCFALVLMISLTGCGGVPGSSTTPIQVNSTWIKTGTSGNNTAAFMLIKNTANQDDKLIKAESNISKMVSLMNVVMKDKKMQMVGVDSIAVPANGQVELKSGSYHVMFMGLKKDLKEGDNIQLTLTFEKGGPVQLNVPVQSGPGAE